MLHILDTILQNCFHAKTLLKMRINLKQSVHIPLQYLRFVLAYTFLNLFCHSLINFVKATFEKALNTYKYSALPTRNVIRHTLPNCFLVYDLTN